MTENLLAGFVLGLLAATIALLVYSRLTDRNGEIELPDDLLLQIGEIIGRVAHSAACLGKALTPGQVEQIADWVFFRFPPVRQLFTQEEWRGLLALILLWLTDGPPAAAEGGGPEEATWQEFETFVSKLV